MQPGTLGHYDPASNRVFLFDATKDAGYDWSENADTIIHEATHQTAYNVGVHKRFIAAPRWMVEGLATMFEARGVWNAQYDRTQTTASTAAGCSISATMRPRAASQVRWPR